jgi:uncharacterized protein YjbJ (UPF0337 family)
MVSASTWRRIEQVWSNFEYEASATWPDAAEDELAETGGNRDKLIDVVQQTYGIARERAAYQVDDFADLIGERL